MLFFPTQIIPFQVITKDARVCFGLAVFSWRYLVHFLMHELILNLIIMKHSVSIEMRCPTLSYAFFLCVCFIYI